MGASPAGTYSVGTCPGDPDDNIGSFGCIAHFLTQFQRLRISRQEGLAEPAGLRAPGARGHFHLHDLRNRGHALSVEDE